MTVVPLSVQSEVNVVNCVPLAPVPVMGPDTVEFALYDAVADAGGVVKLVTGSSTVVEFVNAPVPVGPGTSEIVVPL